jgi:hypothetical protein
MIIYALEFGRMQEMTEIMRSKIEAHRLQFASNCEYGSSLTGLFPLSKQKGEIGL